MSILELFESHSGELDHGFIENVVSIILFSLLISGHWQINMFLVFISNYIRIRGVLRASAKVDF